MQSVQLRHPSPMNTLRFSLCFAFVFLAACQSTAGVGTGVVYPVYASKADALAVVSGNFGVIPHALLGEVELVQIEALSCQSGLVEIQTQNSGRVWMPEYSLPAHVKKPSTCAT